MTADPFRVGNQIRALRKVRKLTQSELGEKLNISFQSVSKWERGETLPDTAILPELADALDTTVDNILNGGTKMSENTERRKITVAQMREGIECFERIGELLGKDSDFYQGAIGGVNLKMQTNIEGAFTDPYLKECFISEAVVQCLMAGAAIDLEDIRIGFQHQHWIDVVIGYAVKYGMK